jgi:hypothetical protein
MGVPIRHRPASFCVSDRSDDAGAGPPTVALNPPRQHSSRLRVGEHDKRGLPDAAVRLMDIERVLLTSTLVGGHAAPSMGSAFPSERPAGNFPRTAARRVAVVARRSGAGCRSPALAPLKLATFLARPPPGAAYPRGLGGRSAVETGQRIAKRRLNVFGYARDRVEVRTSMIGRPMRKWNRAITVVAVVLEPIPEFGLASGPLDHLLSTADCGRS